MAFSCEDARVTSSPNRPISVPAEAPGARRRTLPVWNALFGKALVYSVSQMMTDLVNGVGAEVKGNHDLRWKRFCARQYPGAHLAK